MGDYTIASHPKSTCIHSLYQKRTISYKLKELLFH